MTAPRLTDQQRTAIDAGLSGADLFINAFAGSGKSTVLAHMIVEMIKRGGFGSGIVVAFNVKIVAEFKAKLERLLGGRDPYSVGWEVRSFNSIGHATLKANRFGGNRGLTVDVRKTANIAQEAMANRAVRDLMLSSVPKEAKRSVEVSSYVLSTLLAAILDAAKIHNVTPHRLHDDKMAMLIDLAGENLGYGQGLLKPSSGLQQVISQALQLNLAMAKEHGVIDYNDQVYLSVNHCAHPGRKWNVVVADEVQDSSWANFQQLTRACTKQLVLGGDKYQAIFVRLKAASIDALEATIESRKMKTVVLDRTFRCSQAIAARMVHAKYLPSFVPAAGGKAPLGDIRMPFFASKPGVASNARAIWRFATLFSVGPNAPQTMILTAFNSSLIEAMTLMWLEGDGRLPGSLFYMGQPVPEAVWKAASHLSMSTTARKGTTLLAQACALFLRATKLSPEKAHRFVEKMRERGEIGNQPGIALATVYGVKGLEADRVVLFNPHQMVETPVKYVAESRAKTHLLSASISNHTFGTRDGPVRDYLSWTKQTKPITVGDAIGKALHAVPPSFRPSKKAAKKACHKHGRSVKLVQALESRREVNEVKHGRDKERR